MEKLFKVRSLFHLSCLVVLTGLLSSFNSTNTDSLQSGMFTCMVNEKPFMMENFKAVMRNTTGGRMQLSLSNDRFVKFFFINPEEKDFDLSTEAAKVAIVRYNEPGTNFIYVPKTGHVKIKKIDEATKMITGVFEMELCMPGKDKVIKVTKGEFNVPFVVTR